MRRSLEYRGIHDNIAMLDLQRLSYNGGEPWLRERMARLRMMMLYAGVFGTALLAGLLIASLLASASMSTASITAPTGAPLQQPLSTPTSLAQLVVAAPPAVTPSPVLSTVPPPTTTPPANTIPPTTTATATSAPTPTPTAQQVVTPPPLTFDAQIVEQPTDAAVACGTAFDSRIWGVVKDQRGNGIFGASVAVSSADGQHHYRGTTNDQGGFEIPGLGCTTWEVQLVDLPSAPGGVQAEALLLSLNGGRYSGAAVQFQQR
jgi:hypothetical protein